MTEELKHENIPEDKLEAFSSWASHLKEMKTDQPPTPEAVQTSEPVQTSEAVPTSISSTSTPTRSIASISESETTPNTSSTSPTHIGKNGSEAAGVQSDSSWSSYLKDMKSRPGAKSAGAAQEELHQNDLSSSWSSQLRIDSTGPGGDDEQYEGATDWAAHLRGMKTDRRTSVPVQPTRKNRKKQMSPTSQPLPAALRFSLSGATSVREKSTKSPQHKHDKTHRRTNSRLNMALGWARLRSDTHEPSHSSKSKNFANGSSKRRSHSKEESFTKRLTYKLKGVAKHKNREQNLSTPGFTKTRLERALNDKELLRHYELFLTQSFCQENLDFYMEVQEYIGLEDNAERKSRASAIYKQYIAEDAPTMVNLPSNVKLQISKELEHGNLSLFYEGQQVIFNLMQDDTYPKFLKSREYEKYLRDHQSKNK